jgi:hypothetical protein
MVGWGEQHRQGAGTTGQIEDAHAALDRVGIAPGPLAIRTLAAVGRILTLTEMAEREDEVTP